jgi:hypothetical protein
MLRDICLPLTIPELLEYIVDILILIFYVTLRFDVSPHPLSETSKNVISRLDPRFFSRLDPRFSYLKE